MNQFYVDNPAFGTVQKEKPPLSSGLAFVLCGAAMAAYGLSRRSRGGLVLAAAGGLVAVSNQVIQQRGRQFNAKASFVVNTTPEEAYRFWRDFENLPHFMRYLESVRSTGPGETEWVASGPLGQQVRWKALLVEEVDNQRIAWKSTPDSRIKNQGSVDFHREPNGRGTIVTVDMSYEPTAGPVGRAVAAIFGKNPEFTVREDLRRFKALIEAGEVPTTIGQPHGPRGAHGYMEQFLFREVPDIPQRPIDETSQLIA